ncbi:uncharacterized protein LOC122059138 [Macadamia integrifolia]|uniref:uncharacterized protein LOC122059138 n=1 Tax=Macadamia integrifolia TaxID=60698 RepID=UPI001C530223|nr:uncharacterized protein LOC122059138 [Macadamia integrifolia]
MRLALPSGVLNLLQLRHLMLSMNETKVPSGIGILTNLQTLTGLYLRLGITEELRSLTQLRKLELMDVSEEHANELSAPIMKMRGLVSLSLDSGDPSGEELLPTLEPFSPPQFIRELRLGGRLVDLPHWSGFFPYSVTTVLAYKGQKLILFLRNSAELFHRQGLLSLLNCSKLKYMKSDILLFFIKLHFQVNCRNYRNSDSLSMHKFAAILPGDSIAEIVATNGILNFLNIYNTLLIVRLVLTWFPNSPPAIVSPLSTLCDPYLNIFRGIIPPLGGTLDLSPILAFLVLNAFTSAAAALPAELPIKQESHEGVSSSNPRFSNFTTTQKKWMKRCLAKPR